MSEFLFLGTGAADWDISDKKNFVRRHSAALVNYNLMIDCGRHIFDFEESFGKENLYDNIKDVIITHPHGDHVSKDSILKLSKKRKFNLWCDRKIAELVGKHPNIEIHILNAFKEEKIGEYKVIPLMANHSVVTNENSTAFHYIIETYDGKKIFYGLDGAWFLRTSWEEMKKHKFDIMVFDCTVGEGEDWRLFEHNTIPMLRLMTNEIKRQNMLSENGKLIASHMAKSLHGTHEETESILGEFDMTAAYDGLLLSF